MKPEYLVASLRPQSLLAYVSRVFFSLPAPCCKLLCHQKYAKIVFLFSIHNTNSIILQARKKRVIAHMQAEQIMTKIIFKVFD
jgi:hypothetical protein